MSHGVPQPDDLNELESRLASWQPSAHRLESDRMLFAAGQAAAAKNTACLAWQAVSGALALLTIVLGIQLSMEHERHMAQQIPKPAASESAVDQVAVAEPLSPDSFLMMRRAMADGAGDLPSTAPSPIHTPRQANAKQPLLDFWHAERSLEP